MEDPEPGGPTIFFPDIVIFCYIDFRDNFPQVGFWRMPESFS
jgi:hypothetical protein